MGVVLGIMRILCITTYFHYSGSCQHVVYLYLKQLPIYIARKHDFNKTISKVVLSYWEKADWQRKNIVCNEGIEKKVPEHKDSMKKKNFPTRNHPPPPNQKLNGRPLMTWILILMSFQTVSFKGGARVLIGAGGRRVYIHIFRFCVTNFSSNQLLLEFFFSKEI